MDVEAERWQHDIWYRVVGSGVGDAPEQVRLDDMPGFERHNRGKPYEEQVKPFGFLAALHTRP